LRAKAAIRENLARKRERLKAYYEREAQILSRDGVKSYGIGIRNLTRFDTALADVQKAIRELEGEITALENELQGGAARRALAAVPHGEW
jgi:hypothetical protein